MHISIRFTPFDENMQRRKNRMIHGINGQSLLGIAHLQNDSQVKENGIFDILCNKALYIIAE